MLAHHPLVERGTPVSRLWRAPPDACRAPPVLVGPQGAGLAPPRALLRRLPGAERARRFARGVSRRHRRAGSALSRRCLGAAAAGPPRRVSLAHVDRRVARLARGPPARSASLHAQWPRLDIRDARPVGSRQRMNKTFARVLVLLVILLCAATAQATVGLTEAPGRDGDGPVTVYYPSRSEPQTLRRGPFTFQMAWQGAPVRGNGRLVIISHGSGGAPWVHGGLARALVEDGFVVAVPAHQGDNVKDPSTPGPPSWKRRPAEVSRAIDVVGEDPRFKPLLALDKVGMYGMSAGGHTALVLAGGRWSPARLAAHCEAHIAEDFQACVGLSAQLDGGAFDGIKKTIARWVIRYRLRDATWQTHADARIASIVAAVPFAADFDMASLASPRVPLGLATTRQDRLLIPRFHSDAVLAACAQCEQVADIPDGGHGAYLSPLPPGLTGLLGDLMNDPPGFRRAGLHETDLKIVAFIKKHVQP